MNFCLSGCFLILGLIGHNAFSQTFSAGVTGTCWSVRLGLAFSQNYQEGVSGYATGFSTYDGTNGTVLGGRRADGTIEPTLFLSGELKPLTPGNSTYYSDFGDWGEAEADVVSWGFLTLNFPSSLMNTDSDSDGLPDFLERNLAMSFSSNITVFDESPPPATDTTQSIVLSRPAGNYLGNYVNHVPWFTGFTPFMGTFELSGVTGAVSINPHAQTLRFQTTAFDGSDTSDSGDVAYTVQNDGTVRMTNVPITNTKTNGVKTTSMASLIVLQKLGGEQAKGSLRLVDGDLDTPYPDFQDYHLQLTSLDPRAFAPRITAFANTNHLVGQAFSLQPTATHTPSGWASPGAPAWLSINSSSGLLSGTPSNPGSWPISVVASNAWGGTTNTFTLTVVSLASNWFGSLAPTNIAPDGMTYLLKYGYGGRTNSHDGDLRPSMVSQSNQMTFTFFARTNDTNLSIVPVSGTNLADLASWSSSNLTVVSAGTTNRNGETLAIRRVTVPLTNNPEKRFVRLQVQLKNP